MGEIHWTGSTRTLGDLKPWPRNPRQVTKEQAERLEDSLQTFGQVDVIAIGPDNEVYNGHQRLNVWLAQHGPGFEVAVRVASRALSERERTQLMVYLHEGAAGDWNFETLSNEFNLGELIGWGFKERGMKWIADEDALDLEDEPEEADEKAQFTCPKCGFSFYV